VLLLELAAQGVRGFAPATGRLALRPGYNVVGVDGPGLRRLLQALWYPASAGDAGLRPAAEAGVPPARAGLTLVGDDAVTWRLLRDLGGGVQLQRFDPERRAFLLASQDAEEIAGTLLGAAGVAAPGRLDALLSLAAADLPSRQAPAGLGGGAPAARRAMPPEEARRRIAALGAELEQARAADKLQYQLDGLQGRFFKLEELLRVGAQLREQLRAAGQAAAAWKADPAIEALGDAAARISAYERALARRDEALARLLAEREGLEARQARAGSAPPWADPWAVAGAAAAAAALASALATGWRALALVAIPASAVPAFRALRWIGDLEERERAVRRRRALDDRERRVHEACERDAVPVRSAMKAAGVESAGELRDALARRDEARAAADDAQQRLAEWEASPEARDAEEEKARLGQQIGEIEQQLSTVAGGYARDPRAVEAEIARLEADLRAPRGPEEAPAPAPAGDPLRALVEGAAGLLGGTPGAALRAAQPRLGQLLPAVSGQRMAGCLVDERGNLLVQAGGKVVPASGLATADRDLCWLSLKVAFLEQALVARKSVALIDDAFAGLPEPARRTFAGLLKQLGRAGQILHATSDPIFREAADHAA
jgi:hypothetical protein